jgi:hypothetical protein
MESMRDRWVWTIIILTLHATQGEMGSENGVLVVKPIGNKPVEEICRNGKIILKCNLS